MSSLSKLCTIMEQLTCVLGLNRANSKQPQRLREAPLSLLYQCCQISYSKSKDIGYFPRWPHTRSIYFMKLDILMRIDVKINVLRMLNSPLNVPGPSWLNILHLSNIVLSKRVLDKKCLLITKAFAFL